MIEYFWNLKLTEWLNILGVVIAAGSLYQLWSIRKANKRNMPMIADSVLLKWPTYKEIKITIINPSQTEIVIKNFRVKKRLFGLFIRNIPIVSWEPPSIALPNPLAPPELVLHTYSWKTLHSFKGQAEYRITLPPNIEVTTYKVSARTTGGRCSTICRPSKEDAR